MTISWQGFNYFRLKNSSTSLILNPYGLDKATKFSKVKSDVALFSDPSKFVPAKVDKDAFVIDSPGEFEVGGVFVYGRQVNGTIIYLIVLEGIKIAFLGEFGHEELANGDLELIEGADILILPVGGEDFTTAKEAGKIIRQVEPRIIIPSCHKGGCGKLKVAPVTDFIKEMSLKSEELDKLSIKKNALPQDEMQLVILKAQK